jgi:hypothetical protein
MKKATVKIKSYNKTSIDYFLKNAQISNKTKFITN